MFRANKTAHTTPLLVVSWYKLFAECLAAALRRIDQFAVATAHFDKPQICAHVETNPSSIILLTADRQDGACLELIAFLSHSFGDAKILILGKPASHCLVLNYLEAGAQGYISGDASLSEIGMAIHQIANGEVVCSHSDVSSIFGRLANLSGENHHSYECESQMLTLRESEILELMAGGLTNLQIAGRLSISAHTVKNHVHNILGKLRVNRRLLAVREVYGRKWLNVERLRTGQANSSSPDRPKSPSSAGDEASANSSKSRSSDAVRRYSAGR